MKIVFVRHGELEGENSSVLHGAADPVSLSEKGGNTMLSASSVLKSMGIGMIVSSPEVRTKESAEIIARELSLPVRYMDELQGRKWGEFAGKSWDEVSKILGAKTLAERYTFVPPQGESWEQFERRILKVVNAIVTDSAGKNVCIISHGSVIRVLLPKIFGIAVEESLKMYPEYGSIRSVEYDGQNYTNPVVQT